MSDNTRWAPYTLKADCIRDILAAAHAPGVARLDVRERASNTSNAAWAAISDKGSGVVAGPLVNSSDTASTDTANTRWAIYANMAEIVADMDVSMGSGADKWHDIAQRMSRSDTSQWNS